MLSEAEATEGDRGLDATKHRCPRRHKLSPTLDKHVFLGNWVWVMKKPPRSSTFKALKDHSSR